MSFDSSPTAIRRVTVSSLSRMPNVVILCASSVHASLPRAKDDDMKRKSHAETDDLRPEYDFDFSTGERGRYFKRLIKEGANVAVIDPDLTKAFPDSAAVNAALRSLLEVARASTGLTGRSTRTARKRAAG
jgi:hypothetical protein